MPNGYRVSEALERQIDIYHWFNGRDGQMFLADLVRDPDDAASNAGRSTPSLLKRTNTPEMRGYVKRIINRTPLHLREADAYYVDSNICHLCAQSAKSLDDWTLYPEYLPSKKGFMLLEHPPSISLMQIASSAYDNRERLAGRIFGIQWAEIPETKNVSGGIYMLHYATMFGSNLRGNGKPFTWPLLPIFWSYGDTFSQTVADPFAPDDAVASNATPEQVEQMEKLHWHGNIRYRTMSEGAVADLTAYFSAFLSFVKQRILVERSEKPDRLYRKNYENHKIDWKQDPGIRVITLRKVDHKYLAADSGEHSHPDWQFRWAVSGHWRNQWYPSRQTHQPVWINSYIKGDPAKPLKPIPQTVFNVSR